MTWEPTQADRDSIAVMRFFKRLAPWIMLPVPIIYVSYYVIRRLS